jgi:hypothetical protein
MGQFNERQRAELRDSIARSRIEAREEMRQLAKQHTEAQETARATLKLVALPVRPTAFDICGLLAETLTCLEDAVADLDNDVLSADVHVIRLRLRKVGDQLARMRSTTAGTRNSFEGRARVPAGRTL